jgi:hypothetical protein
MTEIFSSSQPEIILGSVGSGGGNSPALSGASLVIENFPFNEGGWISDPNGDLWNVSPVLSFVSMLPIQNFGSLIWMEQMINQTAGHRVGNIGIWGMTAGTFASAVKLADFGLIDAGEDYRYVFPTPLVLTGYLFLCIASDPPLGGSGLSYCKQPRLGADDINSPTFQFPDSSYLGVHLGGANSTYSAIPLIPSNNSKYFMEQWFRIGVS